MARHAYGARLESAYRWAGNIPRGPPLSSLPLESIHASRHTKAASLLIRRQVLPHPGCVWSVSFTDSARLVTGCSDAVARVWAADDIQALAGSFHSHHDEGNLNMPNPVAACCSLEAPADSMETSRDAPSFLDSDVGQEGCPLLPHEQPDDQHWRQRERWWFPLLACCFDERWFRW